MRCRAIVLVGGLVLGCGNETVGLGGDESTTGEELEPCERVLDPAIYPEQLVWTPPQVVADESCPASGPSYVLDLPAPVQLTGMVTYEGEPGVGLLILHGRSNEGEVRINVDIDGSFAAEVLPGRYDVELLPNATVAELTTIMTVAEDLEIVSPTMLPIDVPVVTVSGVITMDGEPAPDLYGWVFVPSYQPWKRHMLDGSYSTTATPGTYTIHYDSCDPTNLIPELGSLCYDPEHPPVNDPPLGPDQKHVPFMQLEVGEEDLEVDIDVPTVTVSGTLSLDGEPYEAGVHFDGDVPNACSASDGAFSERWVATHYEHVWMQGLWIEEWSGYEAELLPQLEMLDTEVNLDVARTSASVTATWPTQSPLVGPSALLMWLPGSFSWLKLLIPWTASETLEFSVWPGERSVALVGRACWPDLESELGPTHPIALMLGESIDVSGAVAFDAFEDEWAAVHIDLLGDGPVSVDGVLAVEPIAQPPDSTGFYYEEFPASGPALDVHGFLPRGPAVVWLYGVPVGVADIQDGTTLFLRPTLEPLALQFQVDGARLDGFEDLKSAPIDHPTLDSSLPTRLPPGRYLLIYDPLEVAPDDGLPDNHDAVVGCITREG